jgi:hypothetical protein
MADKENIKIVVEHIESEANRELSNEIINKLSDLKKLGLLDFNVMLKRKCDFCGKILKDNDKFKTQQKGNKILDKCEDCLRKWKKEKQ